MKADSDSSAMRCPACHTDNPGTSRFCNRCGARLEGGETVTLAPSGPTSSSSDEGRFPAGSVLGERYRILGLLGRGGMGEVYRAFDLKLDQAVALKFLPPAAASNARLLERFRGEVRIARQISHRNVCRVYDLGEVNGAPFISMEYVDGEDLGSLLRRIGRLPSDKAIEFARKMCAGLAAAHEKGVLHRDLKPANIMIDGRGQVLIMDFGLAAVADAVAGGDIRSGTPAYMAPEQKEGREVTVRSDLYSLGLVLAEMFTGQKASQEGARSSAVKDIDPVVDKVIQRCLDPNPSRRPASALEVARALPGGDPLAEALAAGDTPSPEMVAASEEQGALSVRVAVACLALVVAGLLFNIFFASRNSLVNLTPLPYSAEILAQKASEIAVRLGYADPPLDKDYAFYNTDYFEWAAQNLEAGERRSLLAKGDPPPIIFRLTQSPRYIAPAPPFDYVLFASNVVAVPGMSVIQVDPQGRLVRFKAVPQRREAAQEPPPRMEWSKLFEAAGLDLARWTRAEPEQIPEYPFDERAAWTGTYPGAPRIPLRIEAAAWQGRPVWFEIRGPWSRPAGSARVPPLRVWLQIAVLWTVFLGAAWLGIRNFRSGRGDRSGALRLAVFMFIGLFVDVLLIAHHTPDSGEVGLLLDGISRSLLLSMTAWAAYMTLEPYVRRHWPHALVSWTRILAGNLRDPVVAGHILLGMGAGFVLSTMGGATRAISGSVFVPNPAVLEPVRFVGDAWFGQAARVTSIGLAVFFTIFLARVVLRRTWLAFLATLSLGFLVNFSPGQAASVYAVAIVTTAIFMGLALRFGLVPPTAAALFSQIAALASPANFGEWYGTAGWMHMALVLAVAIWAFRNALGGRKVWEAELLE